MKKRIVVVQGTLQMLVAVSILKFIEDENGVDTEDYLLIGSLYSEDKCFIEAIIDSAKIWKWKHIFLLPSEIEDMWRSEDEKTKYKCIEEVRNFFFFFFFGEQKADECLCCRNWQPANEIAIALSKKVLVYGDGLGVLDSILTAPYVKPDCAYLFLPYEKTYKICQKINCVIVPKEYFLYSIDKYIENSILIKNIKPKLSHLNSYIGEETLLFLMSTLSHFGLPDQKEEIALYCEEILQFADRFKNIVIKSHPRCDKDMYFDLEQKIKPFFANTITLDAVPHLAYIPSEVVCRILPFNNVHAFISSSAISLNWLYKTEVMLASKKIITKYVKDTWWSKTYADGISDYHEILVRLKRWDGKSVLLNYTFKRLIRKKSERILEYGIAKMLSIIRKASRFKNLF